MKKTEDSSAKPILTCRPKLLRDNQLMQAMWVATTENPVNRPRLEMLPFFATALLAMQGQGGTDGDYRENMPEGEEEVSVDDVVGATQNDLSSVIKPYHLAALSTKYWGARGAKLSVSFLDSPNTATKRKILAYLNKWNAFCNISFTETRGNGIVRLTRHEDGYWSYIGTDNLLIPSNEATMCLEGFTEHTDEREYERVPPHEGGHAAGFPHEHARRKIIEQLDAEKTIAVFERRYGWPRQVTIAQVLVPLEERSLLGLGKLSPEDPKSIMCYQFDGECTKSGKPITGGDRIDAADKDFASRIYPKSTARVGAPRALKTEKNV